MAYIPSMQAVKATDGSSRVLRFMSVKAGVTIIPGTIVVKEITGFITNAADAAADDTVVGIAQSGVVTAAAAGADKVMVDVNPNMIYRMKYEGAAVPILGAKYDLGANGYTLDSADTVGGFITAYDNIDSTNKYVDVVLTGRVFAN